MGFHRFRNQPRKLYGRPGIWRPKIGEFAPGHIGDDKPHGFRRFDRWQKRPVRAWKLYWRGKTRRSAD